MSERETVNVEVELPPDSGPRTTEASNPSPVVVVNPTAPNGEAFMGDLLDRIGKLETETEALRNQVAAVESIAVASAISTPEEEPEADPEPEAEETTEITVPDSSDAGPREVNETPAKKPGWHHWI